MGQTESGCYCDFCGRLIEDREPVVYYTWTFHSDWCRAGKFKLIHDSERLHIVQEEPPKRFLPKGVH